MLAPSTGVVRPRRFFSPCGQASFPVLSPSPSAFVFSLFWCLVRDHRPWCPGFPFFASSLRLLSPRFHHFFARPPRLHTCARSSFAGHSTRSLLGLVSLCVSLRSYSVSSRDRPRHSLPLPLVFLSLPPLLSRLHFLSSRHTFVASSAYRPARIVSSFPHSRFFGLVVSGPSVLPFHARVPAHLPQPVLIALFTLHVHSRTPAALSGPRPRCTSSLYSHTDHCQSHHPWPHHLTWAPWQAFYFFHSSHSPFHCRRPRVRHRHPTLFSCYAPALFRFSLLRTVSFLTYPLPRLPCPPAATPPPFCAAHLCFSWLLPRRLPAVLGNHTISLLKQAVWFCIGQLTTSFSAPLHLYGPQCALGHASLSCGQALRVTLTHPYDYVSFLLPFLCAALPSLVSLLPHPFPSPLIPLYVLAHSAPLPLCRRVPNWAFGASPSQRVWHPSFHTFAGLLSSLTPVALFGGFLAAGLTYPHTLSHSTSSSQPLSLSHPFPFTVLSVVFSTPLPFHVHKSVFRRPASAHLLQHFFHH